MCGIYNIRLGVIQTHVYSYLIFFFLNTKDGFIQLNHIKYAPQELSIWRCLGYSTKGIVPLIETIPIGLEVRNSCPYHTQGQNCSKYSASNVADDLQFTVNIPRLLLATTW
jgi:hypothetical protein